MALTHSAQAGASRDNSAGASQGVEGVADLGIKLSGVEVDRTKMEGGGRFVMSCNAQAMTELV